ncbi:MAG: MBL fold metallo-hydrolase [Chitinophagaceae bacterium]
MKETATITATYLGGPTAILDINGLRFMTDPSLDPPGEKYDSGVVVLEKTMSPAPIDIGNIDIVLLSHDQHFDNLDHAGRKLVEKVPMTFTTMSGAERLKGKLTGMRPWQTEVVTAPDGTEITITATPARHGPAGFESISGEVIGFVISVKDAGLMELYITGDTTYYEGVAEVARRFNPRYVFVFAGAAQVRGPFNVTMSTNDAMDTALAFPSATIIPLHYEGWKHYTQNEKDIRVSYKVLGIENRLKVLQAGVPEKL